MARLVAILSCRECPNFRRRTLTELAKCLKVNKEIDDIWSIPRWCPLPETGDTNAETVRMD